MKKSAFTLIELLVVISIIAILAAIALPVYQKVMENARATTDGANLKQLGLGVVTYLNDNEDQIFSDTAGTDGKFWPALLQTKYVTDWKVFRSPFDKRPPGNQTDLTTLPVSYGVNVNVLKQPGKPGWDGNWSKLSAPSQLILMAPAMDASSVKDVIFKGVANQAVPLPAPSVAPKLGTHSGRSRINALYADSHVAAITYGPSTSAEAYNNTTGDAGLRRWNPLVP